MQLDCREVAYRLHSPNFATDMRDQELLLDPLQAAAELVISADGRFLYASNRGSQGGKSSIAIFSISPGDGSLSPVGWGDGGGVVAFPRHISLTPCDTHLLVSGGLEFFARQPCQACRNARNACEVRSFCC